MGYFFQLFGCGPKTVEQDLESTSQAGFKSVVAGYGWVLVVQGEEVNRFPWVGLASNMRVGGGQTKLHGLGRWSLGNREEKRGGKDE